jgi:uncharacterized protein YgiM (DUF1202 family)
MASKKKTVADETVETPEITEPAAEETPAETKYTPAEAASVSDSDTGGIDEQAGTSEGEPLNQDEPKATLASVNAANGLNLRVGPGASFAVLEVLPMGTAVAVLGLPYDVEVPGWALVHTGTWCGWVRREYLVIQEEA